MDRKEGKLWNGIKNFKFDNDKEDYSFSTKLSFENTWSEKFTKEAILEYRRFMFLATVSKEMVSPSHIVDIVWHLHLTCSDSYDKFCNVLGKKIKHVPSNGTSKDVTSLRKAAKDTADLYKKHFQDKNKVIYSVRSFEEAIEIEDPGRILRKIDNYHLASLYLLSLGPLFFLWKPILINVDSGFFIFLAFIFFLLTILMMYLLLMSAATIFCDKIKEASFLKYFNEYEILSYLEKSSEKLILLKINKMLKRKELKVDKSNKGLINVRKNNKYDKHDTVIKNYVKQHPNKNLKDAITTLKTKRVFKVTEKIGNLLDKKIIESKSFFNLRVYIFIILLFYYSFIISRLVLGFLRDKPILYLLVFTIISMGVVYYMLYHFFNFKNKSIFINSVRDEINTSEFIDDYFKNGVKDKEMFDANLLLLLNNNNLKDISSKPSNNWSSCSSCSSGGGDSGSSCSSCGGCGGCGD